MKIYPKKSRSPIKAIRFFCFECCGWDRGFEDSGKPFVDVQNCTSPNCPLFDFRFGRNPFHSRAKTDARQGLGPSETDENRLLEASA